MLAHLMRKMNDSCPESPAEMSLSFLLISEQSQWSQIGHEDLCVISSCATRNHIFQTNPYLFNYALFQYWTVPKSLEE